MTEDQEYWRKFKVTGYVQFTEEELAEHDGDPYAALGENITINFEDLEFEEVES